MLPTRSNLDFLGSGRPCTDLGVTSAGFTWASGSYSLIEARQIQAQHMDETRDRVLLVHSSCDTHEFNEYSACL